MAQHLEERVGSAPSTPTGAWPERRSATGLTAGTIWGITKKIGVSLRQALYDWAAREVEEGRAESVSALIAEGLELLEARAQLEAIVTGLHSEVGELDDQARVRLAEALAAADEAGTLSLPQTTAISPESTPS